MFFPHTSCLIKLILLFLFPLLVFVLWFLFLDTPWCSPIKVKYGYANCRSPQEGYYRNVLGTTCDIRCQKGYELHGPQHLICQSNKRWSGKVLCKRKWLIFSWRLLSSSLLLILLLLTIYNRILVGLLLVRVLAE